MDDPASGASPYTEARALELATHRHYKGGLYRSVKVIPDRTNGRAGCYIVNYEHLWPYELSEHGRDADEFRQKVHMPGNSERYGVMQPRFVPLRPVGTGDVIFDFTTGKRRLVTRVMGAGTARTFVRRFWFVDGGEADEAECLIVRGSVGSEFCTLSEVTL